jgi:hypothetical protein
VTVGGINYPGQRIVLDDLHPVRGCVAVIDLYRVGFRFHALLDINSATAATEDAKQREQHQPVTADSEGSHRCSLFQSYSLLELAKLLGIVGGEEGKVK